MRAFPTSVSAIVLGLLLLTGCSKGTSCWVKGQVTYAGKPIEDGNIVLRPSADTPGPPVAAKITGGKYEISKDKGLKAGKYLVLITAANNGVQYIPDKYNIASELKVDLQGGANDGKDFALEEGTVTKAPVMKGEEKLVP